MLKVSNTVSNLLLECSVVKNLLHNIVSMLPPVCISVSFSSECSLNYPFEQNFFSNRYVQYVVITACNCCVVILHIVHWTTETFLIAQSKKKKKFMIY